MKDEQVFQATAQSSPQCQGALGMYLAPRHRDRRNEFGKQTLNSILAPISLAKHNSLYTYYSNGISDVTRHLCNGSGIHSSFLSLTCFSRAGDLEDEIEEGFTAIKGKITAIMQKQRTWLGLHIFKEFCWKWREMTDRLADRQTSYMRR